MNISSIAPGANASQGNDQKTLQRITEPAINIAVMERSVSHLKEDLNALVKIDISVKTTGTPDEVVSAWSNHFAQFGLRESPVLADVRDLLERFQAITGTNTLRAMLSTIHNNMCKQFHTDINNLRMLCTYHGAGTFWVAEQNDDRDAMLIRDDKGHVNPRPNSIRQAQAGDVLVLKGALYPNGQPVLHRSPPVESEDSVRLLLRIDTNEKLFT